MKNKFIVQQLTDEGRIIDVPNKSYFSTDSGPFLDGYETEAEAEAAIIDYSKKESWQRYRLTILKIYIT